VTIVVGASLLCLAALLGCANGPDTVTIYRDIWGVPHIYADPEELGFYGLGYAEAEDQLLKLLGAVFWYRGRMAELEGAPRLAFDIEQRRWRHAEEAEAGFNRLSPELQRNYEAFVAGVKRYLREHPEKDPGLGVELTAVDLVGISRAIFNTYALVEGPKECSTAGIALNDGLDEIVGGILPGASNGWALAPSRTADRATLLVADPHTELQNPSYYEFRMHAGGIDSSGFALGPLLWQVHTRDVSWAMTTGNPDMWDCYEVETDPSNPRRFLFDGRWQEMELREETFQVLDGEPVTRSFSYTRHNGVLSPVVGRHGNLAYVVSISQMHDTGILDEEIYRMNRARSVPELFEAMRSLGMFPQNLVLGDSSGNISYLRAGKTPVRPAGFDWTRPVPGNSSDTAWRGFHPLEDLVQVHNPPQGYIQNNNVAPDRLFADGNLDASSYPVDIFHDTPGRITSRGLRSVQVLSAADGFTVADATALAFDELWITADDWVRALRSVTDRYPALMDGRSLQTREFVDSLLGFDGVAAADSAAALDFYYWRRGMGEVFKRPEFERLRHLPWPAAAFSRQVGQALLDRADAAAREMVEELGRIDVPLGEVFRVGRGEASWPLGGESINLVDVPGCIAHLSPLCERTMRAYGSGPMDDHRQRRAYRGSHSMRLVVFSDPIQSYSLKVYGQSDDPQSPHYDDQARLASERRFKPTFFDWNRLEENIESTMTLKVDGRSEMESTAQ